MDDITALNRFIEDLDCLLPVTAWVDKLNIFDILGISRTEIRHSNMLAWLMDPSENHGLGDAVLKGIFAYATDDPPREYDSFSVYREWNSIDMPSWLKENVPFAMKRLPGTVTDIFRVAVSQFKYRDCRHR